MTDELAKAVARIVWEPGILDRITAILNEVSADLETAIDGLEATDERFKEALARYQPAIRARLHEDLGDGTPLRDEALFALATASLAQVHQEILGDERERALLVILPHALADFAREHNVEIDDLSDDLYAQAVDECATKLGFSAEVGREIARRAHGRPK